jgi:hypothetical protein
MCEFDRERESKSEGGPTRDHDPDALLFGACAVADDEGVVARVDLLGVLKDQGVPRHVDRPRGRDGKAAAASPPETNTAK